MSSSVSAEMGMESGEVRERAMAVSQWRRRERERRKAKPRRTREV
jgi:hypothetical protein